MAMAALSRLGRRSLLSPTTFTIPAASAARSPASFVRRELIAPFVLARFASNQIRKQFKGKMKSGGISTEGNAVCFGGYGLQALESAWITAKQIEAGRRVLARYARHGGKVWVRVYAFKSVTGKPAEVRMGRGKGAIKYCVSVVKPGRMIYEIGGVSERVARTALTQVAGKLGLRTRFRSGGAPFGARFMSTEAGPDEEEIASIALGEKSVLELILDLKSSIHFATAEFQKDPVKYEWMAVKESEADNKLGQLGLYEIGGGTKQLEVLQNLAEFLFSCIPCNSSLKNSYNVLGARASAKDS